MKISARNQLEGKIKSLNIGMVNAEVVLELPGGITITSVITKTSAENLKLAVGKEAFAVVKASDVLIGVCGKDDCDCK
jgi:molybdopterin-binding protein